MKKLKKAFSVILMIILILNLFVNINEEVYAADNKIEKAISWAIDIANDDRHGYSQSVRWGPHYDCSSFVYSAFSQAGFSLPNSGTRYTQTMVNHFTKAGFIWIPWNQIGSMNNLQRGDILLNNSNNSSQQHTEIYLGNGKNVGAHSPSKGISVSGYYNHPWSGVLRYVSQPPSNPQISKSQVWYDMGDIIEISACADGATGYFMSMFKDGNKIISQGVDGGRFSMNASAYGQGDYSVYFSCSNSAGTVDTQWIDFTVVGSPAYSDVRSSDWWYDLSDTVSISVDTVCAKGQVIGIDKEGFGRIITENTESVYEIPASKLGVGNYSAYFSVYNGSGSIDTKRVEFGIVDSPKKDAVVSTGKTNYSLDEEVDISVLVYCSKYQVIGIDKNGTERVITETLTDGKYKIPASKLGPGKYSAYFSVWNNSGGYDTSRVEFAIDSKLSNPKISIAKTKWGLNEKLEISASVDGGGGERFKVLLYDDKGSEILNQNIAGNKFALNTSEIGEGKYTAKVVCNNNAFCVETGKVMFEVACVHNYLLEDTKKANCITDGYKKYKCSYCKKEYAEVIPAVGHSWDSGKITEKATAAKDGTYTYTCVSCGVTRTEKIPATGQSGNNNNPGESVKPSIKPVDSTKPVESTKPSIKPVDSPKPVESAKPSIKPVDSPKPSDQPYDILPGDANLDKTVNLRDAQLVLKAALGIIKFKGIELKAADVNHDGVVNLIDAQTVLRLALGITVNIPAYP